MATYIFQVNLNIPYGDSGVQSNASSGASNVAYKYGAWPDVASNQTSIATSRCVWIPINKQKDNKELHHGDVFFANGENAYYLLNHYTLGNSDAAANQTPPPADGAILNVLWQTSGSYTIPQTVLNQIQALNPGGLVSTSAVSTLMSSVTLTGVKDAVGVVNANPSVSGNRH